MKLRLKDCFFCCCVLFVIIYRIILMQINEAFPYAYEIGDLLFQVALAYFTGYIFYLLVDFFPKKKDRRIIYTYIESKRKRIISNFDIFIDYLIAEIGNVQIMTPKNPEEAARMILARELDVNNFNSKNLTENDFRTILRVIGVNDKSPVSEFNNLIEGISWYNYLVKHTNIIINLIYDIFTVMPYIDAEHINLLAALQDSDFIGLVNNSEFLLMCENLDVLYVSIYKYYNIMRKIDKVWD